METERLFFHFELHFSMLFIFVFRGLKGETKVSFVFFAETLPPSRRSDRNIQISLRRIYTSSVSVATSSDKQRKGGWR
jgi:hypothetical protein